jgi:hypothetical protein
MARHEADREDIMREALALRRRVAIAVPGYDEPFVCGVRSNGSWSFYLDPDRVYQVDKQLRLRRAFVEGFLYRTQGATLARMHRERSDTETKLVRKDLSTNELNSFLDDMRSHLQRLLDFLQADQARVIEVIPPEADVAGELQRTLEKLLSGPIKLAPAIKA